MTKAELLDEAIVELTRAKVTINDDPAFAMARITDARFIIAAVAVQLGIRTGRGYYRLKEGKVA